MAAYKIVATNPTSFTVSSLDGTVEFFRGVLGFEPVHRGLRDPDFVEQVVYTRDSDGVTVEFIQPPSTTL